MKWCKLVFLFCSGLARVEASLGASFDEFVEMRKASERAVNGGRATAEKYIETGELKKLDTWIRANPQHPAEPFVRFCQGRVLARAGRGEESREIFTAIRDKDGLRCTLRDDAQFWIGLSHNWGSEFSEAKDAFGVLLRDFPASHSAKQVAGKFQPAGPVTEQ